ncbi:MAG: hypothetical protein ABIS29_01425 [Vicinamibacterales bacterium]
MMTCGRARRLAWPDGAPRVVDDDVAAAEAHMAQCASCRAFITDMRVLAERLSASEPQVTAPREVRERLFASLARARSEFDRARVRRVTSLRLAGAGAVALLVLATAVWRLSSPPAITSEVTERLADDHRRALRTHGITSSDTAAVARWLSSRVEFAVHAPTFTNGQLVGARLVDVNAQRGAVLTYRIGGVDVSYYILPTGEGGTAGEKPGEPAVQVTSWTGFRIATWQEPGLTHALVGDLPAARLTGLAHECITQMIASLWRPLSGSPPAHA